MICRECGQEKPKASKTSGNICCECNKVYLRKYWARNRAKGIADRRDRYNRDRQNPDFMEAKRVRGREYWRQLRHEAILAYGGHVCACCGESETKFLTLDHVENNGSEHRKAIGKAGRGAGIFRWLKEHGYPPGFQVLCMNCNHGKALNNGICPHKTAQANGVNSGDTQNGQS